MYVFEAGADSLELVPLLPFTQFQLVRVLCSNLNCTASSTHDPEFSRNYYSSHAPTPHPLL